MNNMKRSLFIKFYDKYLFNIKLKVGLFEYSVNNLISSNVSLTLLFCTVCTCSKLKKTVKIEIRRINCLSKVQEKK